MHKVLRNLAPFFAAVFLGAACASVFATQFVIAALEAVNVDIPFTTRLATTFTDLAVLQALAPLFAACYLPGFEVAALCTRHLPGTRRFWFIVGGFTSVLAGLLLLESVFGAMMLAGARSTAGLIMQAVAGAIGGWLMHHLTAQQEIAA